MFLCSKTEFKDFFGNKSLRMVSFYQMMRKKYDLLMDGDKPEGGKWSFDAENEKNFQRILKFQFCQNLKLLILNLN